MLLQCHCKYFIVYAECNGSCIDLQNSFRKMNSLVSSKEFITKCILFCNCITFFVIRLLFDGTLGEIRTINPETGIAASWNPGEITVKYAG